MIEAEEFINFLLSTAFIAYLLYLVKQRLLTLRSYWFAGIILVFCSQVLTIVEPYFYPEILNIAEHACTCLGSILFLIGVIRKELFWPK